MKSIMIGRITSITRSVLTLGLMTATLTSPTIYAASRLNAAPASVSSRTPLDSFARTLTPTQRQALVDASHAWRNIADSVQLLGQAESDLDRILTHGQADQFWNLIDPSVNAGGNYKALKCWLDSKISFLFSAVALIGCPGDTASEATSSAFQASVYADECWITDAETCESAVLAALDASVKWSQLTGSCDVADTAMYTCAITYASCGGTW